MVHLNIRGNRGATLIFEYINTSNTTHFNIRGNRGATLMFEYINTSNTTQDREHISDLLQTLQNQVFDYIIKFLFV